MRYVSCNIFFPFSFYSEWSFFHGSSWVSDCNNISTTSGENDDDADGKAHAVRITAWRLLV